MRIGICDDDESARLTVSNWLTTTPHAEECDIKCFVSGVALLEHLRFNVLDIIFLDCKMDHMDGIETAKNIRMHNSKAVIILLTDFTRYARFGYGLDILNYVMKNDFNRQIGDVFEKAAQQVNNNATHLYTIKASAVLHNVSISKILYIECQKRKKVITMCDGQVFVFYSKMHDIELSLKNHGFIRPHNSYLVNSRYVDIFAPHSIHLSVGGISVPVSKSRHKSAYDDYTIYVAGM